MTTEQIVIVVVSALAAVAILAYFFDVQFRRTHNLLQAMTDALIQMQSSPVAMSNAKAAGDGISQEAYNKLYVVANAALQLLGANSAAGQLIEQGKELAERIDHDASNDPVPGGTPDSSSRSFVKGIPITPIPPATFQQPNTPRGEDRELAQQ